MREWSGYAFGTGLKEHPKRLYLYLDQLAMTTLPWSIFAVGAVVYAARRFRRSGYGLWAVPALTLGVCLVILTLTPNKRAHYALPVVPLWAMFLTAFMDVAARRTGAAAAAEAADDGGGARLFRWAFTWPLRGVLLCAVVVSVAAPFYWASHAERGKAIGAALLGAAVVPALYGLVASFRRKPAQAVAALLAAALSVTIVARPLATRYYFEPPDRSAVTGIARAIPEGVPVGEYKVADEFLYLKMDRPVTFLHDRAQVRAFLREPGERYLIARAEDAPALSGLTDRRAEQVGSWRLGEDRGIVVTVLALSP
jgi:hypothetical protein